MKYKNIIVPFVGNQEIKQKADNFRNRIWGDKIPVDIEKIIEIKLKIKIIPIPNLFKLCSVDSQISSNFFSIFVDNDSYLYDETNRLNFSLAHEIGHFILHKDLFASFGIRSIEDVLSLVNNIPEKQYNFLETQANKFASYFLIPRENLLAIRRKILANYDLKNIDDRTINSYIASDVAKTFNVSSWAAEIALNDLNSFFSSQK